MRKFLLSMALVLLSGATMAQGGDVRLTAEQLNAKTEKTAILIKCTQVDNHNTYYNPNGRGALGENSIVYWVPAGEGAFYITKGDGENDYLQTGNITTFGTQATAAKFHAVKPTGSGSDVSVFNGENCYENEATGGEYWVRLAFTNDSKWFNFNGNQYNTGTGVWTVQNIYEAAIITYNIKYNDVTKLTVNTVGIVGNDYPEIPASSLPLGVIVTKPEGKVSAEETFDLEATVSVPFEYADSYANVEWQFLKFDSNHGFYLHHVADQDYLALDVQNFNIDDDNYYWGFVGNPFDGYRIVNKGAGEGYILSSSTTMAGTTGSDTWPIMTAEASLLEGNNTLWIPTGSTHAENGFFLAQKDHSSNRMNNRGSKLAYWTAGAGAGSTFIAENVDEAIATLVNSFKANAVKGLGYVGGYTADKADDINAITTYDEMNTFKAENTPIALDVNKYYRIQNVFRNHVISVNPNNERVSAELSKADVNQIWKFENANTEGTYLIKGVNAEAYMQAAGASNTLNATGAEFEVYNLGDGLGQFNLKQKGSNNLMCEYQAGAIGSWTDGGVGSDMAWYLIEANDIEITLSDINGEGWATTYLPFDVTLPDGLTAYYVNEVHDGWVNFAEAEDIPAKNGVVLYTKEPKTYTLTIADATTEIENNYLTGTTVNTNITEEGYVLGLGVDEEGVKDTEVGFAKAKYNVSTDTTNDGTEEEPNVTYEAWLNKANKAYLVLPEAQGAVAFYGFNFEGGNTTAVENVEVENEVEEIYDLQGRRIDEITKPGIYVVNGSKVLVK